MQAPTVQNRTETPPLVTVVIPVYNRFQYVAQAIRSALDQTHPRMQVIVVDDGSADDPRPALASFGDSVELYRKPNGGLSSTRNLGLAHAAGEYIHFVDDDDYLEPAATATLLSALRAHPNATWAAGRFNYVDPDGKRLPWEHNCRYASGDIYRAMIFNNLMGAPATVLARTEVVRALGGFDESLFLGEDWDMWLRLAQDWPIAAVQDRVCNYRVHPNQISTTRWTLISEYSIRMLAKNRATARAGFDDDFRKSFAKLNLEFGDNLYLAGRHDEARARWRQAMSHASPASELSMLLRFIKSYLPSALLDPLRALARRARTTLQPAR